MSLSRSNDQALQQEGFFLSVYEAVSLGWSLFEAERFREALVVLSRYLKEGSSPFQVNYMAAVCHQALGDWDSAEKHLIRALEVDPHSPEAINTMGEIQLARECPSSIALASFEKSAALSPGFASPVLNIGNLYWKMGDIDRSLVYYRRSMEVDPSVYEACYNCARAFHQKGLLADAIPLYSKAAELNAAYAEPLWNQSLCHLLAGEYALGWDLYDNRFKISGGDRVLHAMPRLPLWEEPDLPRAQDQPIVLVSEQGFGDSIQFIRYLRVLSDLGLDVRLVIQPQLHDLVVASGLHSSPLAPADCAQLEDGCWLPLLSLPRLLGVTPSNVITSKPYLRPLKGHLLKWEKLLAQEGLPVVGIHWQGSQHVEATNESFKGRSLPLEAFSALLEDNSVRLLSLQKGFGSEQMGQCSFSDAFVHCQGEVDATWDFLETLAIIQSCDLVITSDSAVAHLAGGLGKTVWLLLMNVPEWRWGLKSDQTFWYPSVRIFRQERQGDWHGLLRSVSHHLSLYLENLASMRKVEEQNPPVYGDAFRVALKKARSRVRQVMAPFWEWVETAAVEDSGVAEAEFVEHGRADSKAFPGMSLSSALEAELRLMVTGLLSDEFVGDDGVVDSLVEVLANHRYPSVSQCLGKIYLGRDLVDRAIACFRAMLRSGERKAKSLALLALCWQIKGFLPRAQGLYGAALRSGGEDSQMLCNYACLLHELGSLDGAIDLLDRAVILDPAHAHAHLNLAFALLTVGDFEKGWAEYEWRLRRPSVQALLADPVVNPWNGKTSLSGKSLLIMGEQGHGDMLQFWRYVSFVEKEAARCVACLPRSLHRLIRASGFAGELCAPDELPSQTFDEWISLGSLPGLLSVSAGDPRVADVYLQSAAELLDDSTVCVSSHDRPLIGICWQANPAAERFVLRNRSIPLEAFAPLAAVERVSMLSLQKLNALDQLDACSFRSSFVDWQEAFTPVLDFSDVAIAMQGCDLIITVDTAVAHLAGAMGHPTWLLLHHVPDWRWGLEGETTFWYPSMRLFRQREAGNWDEVMQRVATALQEFLAARSV